MTDLTKLADDLEVIRQSFREMSHADRSPNWFTGGPRAATAHRLMWQRKGLDVADAIDDAAAILRSAAAVDVAGLMAMVKKATAAHYLLGLASGEWRCTPEHHADKDAADAALESALRLALAAREDGVFTALDMSPETFRTEGGAVNVGKLRAAIRHPADYLPSTHWLAAAAPKGTT